MKKTALLCIFFYVSGLCCFADENIEASPLFPFYGLPVQTFWSTDNTLVWKQADWGLYATEEGGSYKPNHFLAMYALFIGGVVTSLCGFIILGSNTDLGIALAAGGASVCIGTLVVGIILE